MKFCSLELHMLSPNGKKMVTKTFPLPASNEYVIQAVPGDSETRFFVTGITNDDYK